VTEAYFCSCLCPLFWVQAQYLHNTNLVGSRW
jgi:hypothetical protein